MIWKIAPLELKSICLTDFYPQNKQRSLKSPIAPEISTLPTVFNSVIASSVHGAELGGLCS